MGAMSRQPGFFDLDDRYALLSKSGDPLARPASAVNVEMSRFRLEKALKRSPLSGRTSTDRKEADRRAAHQGRHVRTQMNELSCMRFAANTVRSSGPPAKIEVCPKDASIIF